MVISRSFALSSQGTHSMPALIDMADHSLSSNSEIRGQESGDIVMTSKEAVSSLPGMLQWFFHGRCKVMPSA